MRLCKISLIGKEDQKKIGYRLGTLRGRLSGGSSMLRRAPRFHKGLTICGVLACDRYGLQLGCTSHVEHWAVRSEPVWRERTCHLKFLRSSTRRGSAGAFASTLPTWLCVRVGCTLARTTSEQPDVQQVQLRGRCNSRRDWTTSSSSIPHNTYSRNSSTHKKLFQIQYTLVLSSLMSLIFNSINLNQWVSEIQWKLNMSQYSTTEKKGAVLTWIQWIFTYQRLSQI